MSAVTENQLFARSDDFRAPGKVKGSIHLYENTLCFVQGGYITDNHNSGANRFGGMVVKEVDNSSGADGDLNCERYVEGVFTFIGSGFAQTDVGSLVYAVDNFTVSKTATGNVLVGRIQEYIDSTHVRVDIEAAKIMGAIASITSVATTASTNSTPYGYAQAQADAIVTAVNALIVACRAAGIVR